MGARVALATLSALVAASPGQAQDEGPARPVVRREVPLGLRSIGVVSRPPESFPDRRLGAAWAAYGAEVDEANRLVWAAAEKEAEAAQEPALQAYWREVLAARAENGRWPAHEACVGAVGNGRKRCDAAHDQLKREYQNLINDLEKQKRFNDARRVKQELAEIRSKPRDLEGRFEAAKFGFVKRAVLGQNSVFGSWQPNPELVFVKQGLPPLQANGLLLLSLRPGCARAAGAKDGLRVNDVVCCVAGRVIQGDDDWERAVAGLALGQPVRVEILRARGGVWKPMVLGLLPVDEAGLQIIETKDRLVPFCSLKADPKQRPDLLAEARARLANVPAEAVKKAFEPNDGPFAVAVVAVKSKDDGAIVDATLALGPERLQLLNRLALETGWGKLGTAIEPSMNNAKILVEAWSAVIRTWSLETGGIPVGKAAKE